MPRAHIFHFFRSFAVEQKRTCFAGFVLLAGLALLSEKLSAAEATVSGNYKAWQVESPTVYQRSAFRQALHDGTILNSAAFDQVVRWKLSELTQEQNLFDLPKLRKQLRYDLALAGRASVAAAHDRINALALAHLPEIVGDRDYHAGTRFNAILLLGELNAVEERPFAPAAPAQPLSDVLPHLVDWFEGHAVEDSPSDFLPLGALLGILRHAQLGIADETLRQRALRAAVELAEQSRPPSHRSTAGHDWLRRRAIHLLAWLARPGESPLDARAGELVWTTIGDTNGSVNLQVEAALAWSLLAPKMPADRLHSAATLKQLANLAGRVMRSELNDAAGDRPLFVSRQSRRIVASQLGMLSHACRQLGVDVIALRRSPPPTEVAELADLYCGLKAWIGMATDPRMAGRQAAGALAEAMALLERQPTAVAAP